MNPQVRKTVTYVEETLIEGGKPAEKPLGCLLPRQ